ncbi:hypothetical protein MTO96_025646 [Rhipicephalus appendiculatus]
MLPVLEGTLFGVLVLGNFLLGMYFSFRKRALRIESTSVKLEMFLGSRALKTLPLAVSSAASLFSSTGLVGFTAHYYAYGWHLTWGSAVHVLCLPIATHIFIPVLYRLRITSIFELTTTLMGGHLGWAFLVPFLCLPIATHLFIPVLYRLRITSIFEYIRLRFNATISLTTCVTYILLTGGLRGVVWTDCVQFIFIVIAPIALIAKVILDSHSPNSQATALSDIDLRKYLFDYRLDFTGDENVWACIFGTLAASIFRLCLDQMVAQRLLASRTLQEARRTAITSSFLLLLVYVMPFFMALALTVWFRGCDPSLLGVIKRADQILPYYVRTYLVHIPGLVGLFLAGICNRKLKIRISKLVKEAQEYSERLERKNWHDTCNKIQRTLSTKRTWVILKTLLAKKETKSAAKQKVHRLIHNHPGEVGDIVKEVKEKFLGTERNINVHSRFGEYRGKRPAMLPASLDHCPGNLSLRIAHLNITRFSEAAPSNDWFFLYRLSFLWSSAFAILATILLGVVISILTDLRRRC